MKFLVLFVAFVAVASAQYNPYNRYNSRNVYNPYSTPSPYRPYVSSTPAPLNYYTTPRAPVYSTPAPVISKVYTQDARTAGIVRLSNEINPDGSYSYLYETDNGIAAQEQGVPTNLGGNPPSTPVVAQGSFSYTSPEGVPVSISYVADENGFHPQGNVLPTAHPVPEYIVRALEYIVQQNPGLNKQ